MKTLILAASAALLLAVPAQAANLLLNVPMAEQDAGFSWDGLYVGVGPGTELWSPTNEHKIEIEGYFGGNVTMGNVLFGAEAVATGYYAIEPMATGTKFAVTGRAGVLVTPRALVYGEAGVYYDPGFGPEVLAGVGAEFMVTHNVSIDVAYDYDVWLPNTSFHAHQLSLSTLWHFQ